MKGAEAIDRALAGEANALEKYTQIISEEWGSEMVWAKRLADTFYSIPKIGYQVGVKRPSATEIMLKILSGELRYSEVVNRVLRRLGGSLITGTGS